MSRRTKGQESILLVRRAIEVATFALLGTNFFSLTNFFECIRLAAELGLLSLAMTAVIITGGIDLAVGSMMGLAGVIFGALWHDSGLSIGLAISGALAVGVIGGMVNATLIARFSVSP